MKKHIMAGLLISCFLSSLIGCGQTGRLYLPKAESKSDLQSPPPELSVNAG